MKFAQTNRTIRDGLRRWEEMVGKQISQRTIVLIKIKNFTEKFV